MKMIGVGATVLCGLLFTSPSAWASNLVVPRDFPTVQGAVNAAAAGDTVTLRSGTYVEEVVIDKDVDLRGAGIGATLIKSPATLSSYGEHLPDGRSLTAIVRVGRGAHVRMSGLTVEGPIPCATEVTGINALQGATLDLSDARVTGIHADPTMCAPQDAAGRAVVYGTPPHVLVDGRHGTTAYGRISHVAVDDYQHAGISITGPRDGSPSRVTVTNDVVTGGWEIPSDQFGIEIDDGAIARVTDSTIDANVCGGRGCGSDPINEVQGMGILVLGVQPGTRIAGNHLTGNDVGIYQLFSPDCCAITENTLTDNRYFGIVIEDGDGATSDNSISGGQVGIAVVADAVDTTGLMRGDHITNTTVAPVREIQCCGYTATVTQGG